MNAVSLPPLEPEDRGRSWRAQLELGFAPRAGRTAPVRRARQGPLAVQRPFYPEGEVCHLYVLHPPGGLVGGDSLRISVEVADGAHALLTTPGATKFYRSAGACAEQRQHLRVAAGGALEWFPQETIYFDGCQALTQSRIELEPGGRFAGWEISVLGRPAGGYAFEHGLVRQRMEIWRDDAPLWIDAVRLGGDSPLLTGAAGLSGATTMATLVMTPVGREGLDAVRTHVQPVEGGRFAATLKGDVLLCRYLGSQAAHARRAFERVWALLRPDLMGRPACTPRIWGT